MDKPDAGPASVPVSPRTLDDPTGAIGERIAAWVRPGIRSLSAYHVPDAGGYIKLDAMENPFHWPEAMTASWLDLLRTAPLNRYPDPQARALIPHLRQAMAVPEQAGVLLGNGSDEIIQMLAMALAGEGRVILAPEPGFVMYRMIARFTGMEYVGVPLRADFSLDREAMLAAITAHRPALVFLAYPNNPTGNLFDAADMAAIIAATPGVVVVDEAYHAFAGASFMPQVLDHPNLLVMRTVSKMGLAGLRLGLLAGPLAWLREFDKLRLPYNINVLTQLSAEFALRQAAVLDAQTAQICAERRTLFAALSAIADVQVYPSRANFLLFRTPADLATPIFEGLKAEGVLIKNLHTAGGALTDCLRVTVGTAQENAAFLSALRTVLASLK